MPKGWGSPSTSLAIRDYLISKGEACVYEVYKALYQKFSSLGYVPPTYTSIQAIFSALKRLGLIKLIRIEPSGRGLPKAIYKVTLPDDERWRNPLEACYNYEKFRNRKQPEELAVMIKNLNRKRKT